MCGVVGGRDIDGQSVSHNIYSCLFGLQHRGKQNAGIAVQPISSDQFVRRIGEGEIPQVFSEDILRKLDGPVGIGHVMYSTVGPSDATNTQPIDGVFNTEPFVIVHNGQLTNEQELRSYLAAKNAGTSLSTDTGVLAATIAASNAPTFLEALMETLGRIRGAFSIVVLCNGVLYAARDAQGFRPLHIAKDSRRVYIASETCAFSHIGLTESEEILPGEIVVVSASGEIDRRRWSEREREAYCSFEQIYFSRPDSVEGDVSVSLVREAHGRILAAEHPVVADLVVCVPDSGRDAARGFAEAAGLPYNDSAVMRTRASRTFIEPVQEQRDEAVSQKLRIIPEYIRGQRVVVVDDSVVRNTTMPKLVKRLRDAGAREVHVRVAAPPVRHPCYFGIDTYRVKNELAAQRTDTEGMRKEMDADSLGFLSLERMIDVIVSMSNGRFLRNGLCHACFSGVYPVPVPLPQRR